MDASCNLQDNQTYSLGIVDPSIFSEMPRQGGGGSNPLFPLIPSGMGRPVSKVILYAAPFFCLPRQLDMRGSGNPSVSKIVACLGVKKTW